MIFLYALFLAPIYLLLLLHTKKMLATQYRVNQCRYPEIAPFSVVIVAPFNAGSDVKMGQSSDTV